MLYGSLVNSIAIFLASDFFYNLHTRYEVGYCVNNITFTTGLF